MGRTEQLPLLRLVPALAFASIPTLLFVQALFAGFFAGCKLERSRAVIAASAEPFGLGPEALFVLPLVLLPVAIAAALSTIALKPTASRITAAVVIWLASFAAALWASSITSPQLFGGAPLAHRCYLT